MRLQPQNVGTSSEGLQEPGDVWLETPTRASSGSDESAAEALGPCLSRGEAACFSRDSECD